MKCPDMSRGARLAARSDVSAALAQYSDRTATYLVRWLVTALYGCQGEDRDALVRRYAEGERPQGIPEAAAAILTRDAPLAAVMSDFYRKLQRHSRDTQYPLEKIRQLDRMNSSPIS